MLPLQVHDTIGRKTANLHFQQIKIKKYLLAIIAEVVSNIITKKITLNRTKFSTHIHNTKLCNKIEAYLLILQRSICNIYRIASIVQKEIASTNEKQLAALIIDTLLQQGTEN